MHRPTDHDAKFLVLALACGGVIPRAWGKGIIPHLVVKGYFEEKQLDKPQIMRFHHEGKSRTYNDVVDVWSLSLFGERIARTISATRYMGHSNGLSGKAFQLPAWSKIGEISKVEINRLLNREDQQIVTEWCLANDVAIVRIIRQLFQQRSSVYLETEHAMLFMLRWC